MVTVIAIVFAFICLTLAALMFLRMRNKQQENKHLIKTIDLLEKEVARLNQQKTNARNHLSAQVNDLRHKLWKAREHTMNQQKFHLQNEAELRKEIERLKSDNFFMPNYKPHRLMSA